MTKAELIQLAMEAIAQNRADAEAAREFLAQLAEQELIEEAA